jgi:hypothetical protein
LAFKEKMHQRAAVEGSISELVRGHGLRRSRYRGFAKVELQNLLIATACNIKRWLRVILTAKKTSYTLSERLTKAIGRFITPLSRAMASFCA